MVLSIPAGNTSSAITIANIINDTTDEPNETVMFTLSSPSNATLGSDTVHTYTITDDDQPAIEFDTTSSSGAESISSTDITVDYLQLQVITSR